MSVLETLDAYAKEVIWPTASKISGKELSENTFAVFEDSSSTWQGCDTCGPYTDYSVDVTFYTPIGFGVTRDEAMRDYWKREFIGSTTVQGKFFDLLESINAWEASR